MAVFSEIVSLQKIVSSLAARVDQPFNLDLQEELKHIIGYKRANYTQQFMEKHPDQRQFFLQKVTIALEKAPKDDCTPVEGCIIMRTVCKLPKPIRNSSVIFDFVGDSNFVNGYGRQDPAFIQDNDFNRFTANKPKWYYMNDRIYIYNSTVINRIGVRGVFEIPSAVTACACEGTPCYDDGDPYPIALDLLNSIVRDTLQVELRQPLLPEESVEQDTLDEMENRGIQTK